MCVNLTDLSAELLVALSSLRGLSSRPCVEAAPRYAERLAEHAHRAAGLVLPHEFERGFGSTSLSRANQAAAFRISRSCSSRFTSRRSFRSSSRSFVVRTSLDARPASASLYATQLMTKARTRERGRKRSGQNGRVPRCVRGTQEERDGGIWVTWGHHCG
jgi:hypothetical protein